MEISNQLDAPVDLTPRKKPAAHTAQEAGVSQSRCGGGKRKFPAPGRNQTQDARPVTQSLYWLGYPGPYQRQ
jgi:hypothetical protein